MNSEKVIIIGAGAAGLMAARLLKKSEIPFIILEATDRVGGRAYTLEENVNVELGPEFLHGETPITDALMEEFHHPWYDFKFDYHVYIDGKLTPIPDFWERLCGVISEIDVDKDLSFNEYIARFDHHSILDQKIASGFIQGFDAADLEKISTKTLSEMKEQTCDPGVRKMRRPLEGYGRIMQKLAEPILNHIKFSHKINTVEWSGGEVEVRGETGEGRIPFTVIGKQIIVTSSIAVLKNLEINPLPEEVENFLNQNEMGHVVKTVAELSPEFFHEFRENTFPFIAAPDMCFTAWWTTTPIHTQQVTGWAGGEKARKLEKKTSDERREIFIQELATLTGVCPMKINSWLLRLHHHDWSSDDNFLGAYSYPKVFQGKRQEAKTDFDDTFFLAGEAWHTEFSGTIEGAFQTGKEAAEKVIESRHVNGSTYQSRHTEQGSRIL